MKMRALILALLLTTVVFGQNFNKRNIVGVWEISSVKTNGFVSFGTEIGKERREVWTLVFNRHGRLKVQETGKVYNFEVVSGKLKIYESKVYKNGYVVKRKNRYDLMEMSGRLEGCSVVKTTVKKLTGIKKKNGFKMCKIEEMPTPTYQRGIEDYKF